MFAKVNYQHIPIFVEGMSIDRTASTSWQQCSHTIASVHAFANVKNSMMSSIGISDLNYALRSEAQVRAKASIVYLFTPNPVGGG